jgi:prepilin-type N-terminal cleavage/methylation domain-containing protein
MKTHSQLGRGGFTLIELVASAVLAAILMGAVVNIMWSVRRDLIRIRAADASRAPVTILADQMRIDFQNARGMVIDGAGTTLHGFLDRDESSDEMSLRGGRIRYEPAAVADQSVLVRRVLTGSGSVAEAVWFGLGGLRIEPLQQADSGELMIGPATGGLPPIPSRFRVVLTGSDGRPLWREVFDHHAG